MIAAVRQVIRDGALRLGAVADNPRLEARLLLAHALGGTLNDLIRDMDRLVETDGFDALVVRRLTREPVALIVGRREFWSMDFVVSGETLVPRPDSETLIEAALAAFAGRAPPRRILDLGTGTGCLLVALLKEFPGAFGVGIDIAPAAAALARLNAGRLGFGDRCAFLAGHWTEAVKGRFDLIVSNPPYIRAGEVDGLMPEVSRHEPRLALDGGVDGFDAYRVILPALRDHLAADGVGVLEVGEGQAGIVGDLAAGVGFAVSHRLDLAEIPRAVIVCWRNC
jgi:release factor glutamine methyltransferase